MSKNTKFAEHYVKDIIEDNLDRIVNEEPVEYDQHKLTRLYEFEDGAVVKYEWQDVAATYSANAEKFNHKFTLVNLPKPNPHKLHKSIVEVINYSDSGR